MRKRYTHLIWRRRDPRHYRFPLPNAVWEYKLKPFEFVIFSYLCYCGAHGQTTGLAPEVVADGVHLSVDTTRKYLDSLVGRGLITTEGTLAPDAQHTGTEKYFTLPNEIFLLKLPPSAFMVYAYLLLIENRRTHTCHPSYNTIAAAAGMVKNTAMKSISILLERRLITMEHSQYIDKHGMKWKGNNLYKILPVRAVVDAHYQQQLHQLKLEEERRRIRKLQEDHDRRHHRAALCAPAVAQANPDPSQLSELLCSR